VLRCSLAVCAVAKGNDPLHSESFSSFYPVELKQCSPQSVAVIHSTSSTVPGEDSRSLFFCLCSIQLTCWGGDPLTFFPQKSSVTISVKTISRICGFALM